MSHFEIIYLFSRTIEVSDNEPKPQYQIYFKSDETLPYKEENPRTIIKLKAIPQTKLSFKLLIHKPNDVAVVKNSILVKEMNLTPFEPKTFSLPFKTEKGVDILLIFDAFSYFIASEEAANDNGPMLLDFNLYNLTNLEHLVEKVEKPLKKAHKVGFSMVEYELVFVYLKQHYNLKFFANNSAVKSGKNVFIAADKDLGNLSVKVIIFCYHLLITSLSF